MTASISDLPDFPTQRPERVAEQPGWKAHRDYWLAWLDQWPDGHTIVGSPGTFWTRGNYNKFWHSAANVVSAAVLVQLHGLFHDDRCASCGCFFGADDQPEFVIDCEGTTFCEECYQP